MQTVCAPTFRPSAPNITLAELPVPGAVRDAALDYTLRTLPGGKRFFFGVNESEHSVRVELNGSFSQIDAETLEGYAPQSVFEVPPHGSLLAEENGDYSLIPVRAEHMREIVPEFYSAGQNCLTIENVSVGLENGEVLNGYLYGVYETLVKRGYRGKIHVSFSFRSDAARSIRLTAEKQEVRNERFNGEPILSFAQSEEDINFKTARLQARRGENVYEYDAELTDAAQVRSVLFEAGVPESLRNCFSYSTYMEQIYIEGEFDVKNGELVAARPKTAGNLTAQGHGKISAAVPNIPLRQRRRAASVCVPSESLPCAKFSAKGKGRRFCWATAPKWNWARERISLPCAALPRCATVTEPSTAYGMKSRAFPPIALRCAESGRTNIPIRTIRRSAKPSRSVCIRLF